LAPRGDVDWWLDPSLLDPPRLPVDEEPAQEGDESASPTPAPVRTYTEDPASVELADLLDETVGERTVLAMPYAGADRVSLDAAGTAVTTAAARARGDVVWDERGIIPRSSRAPRRSAWTVPGRRRMRSRRCSPPVSPPRSCPPP